MFSTRVVRLIAGKVGYAVSCFPAAVLLVVSGYAHKAVADVSALGGGITIGGSSSAGAMNILVMGLESRTNLQGQRLSSGLLTAMHAGTVAPSTEYPASTNDYCVFLAQGGTAMLTAGLGRVIAGKVGYAVACLLAAVVLVVSGYAHKVVGYASGFNTGVSTGNAPSNSTQAMNILVMGLESRTNFYGQALPPALITAMHTGPVGGQDPNTLILIHIFAGGQKAVGFSIPRDNLVNFPQPFTVDGINIPNGKIDNAYNWAYTESLQKTGFSTKNDYTVANQAGQQAEVNTVEALTGVHVDHFVETNLAGFYTLAAAFHGVEVCLKPAEESAGLTPGQLHLLEPVRTFNSGFNAVKYDGYNREEGRRPVPAPVGPAGARVRARARQPGRGRHRPHPPPAGRHRLRDLAVEARERVRRSAAPITRSAQRRGASTWSPTGA